MEGNENLDAAAQAAIETQEAIIDAEVSTQTEAITELAEAQVEAAHARVEDAQELAQAITDAALQTEMGRQVDILRSEVSICQEENRATQLPLSQMQETLNQIQLAISQIISSTLPTPTIETPAAPSSLIPQSLADPETEAMNLLPESLQRNDADVSPVPQITPAQKRRARLM